MRVAVRTRVSSGRAALSAPRAGRAGDASTTAASTKATALMVQLLGRSGSDPRLWIQEPRRSPAAQPAGGRRAVPGRWTRGEDLAQASSGPREARRLELP